MVTPHSFLDFRVLDHNAFRKDALIGEKRLSLYEVLTHYNGKCEDLELTLDIVIESKHSENQPIKVGELIMLLNGMKIEMNSLQPPSNSMSVHPRAMHSHSSAPLPLGKLKNYHFFYNDHTTTSL